MKTPILFVLSALVAVPAFAADSSFADAARFTGKTGKDVYTGICQGCHMADGQGATGAGMYPALAGDENLESPEYAIYVVIHGQKAMPPLGNMLTDEQIAGVVGYIRTNFGNAYTDPVSVEDVKASR
jgi:mono/diheme cytochrome c family protein